MTVAFAPALNWNPGYPAVLADSDAVLYRAVLYPLYPLGNDEEMAGSTLLSSFPRYFLYGGPTTAGILRSPGGRAFGKGMLAWAAAQQKGIRHEMMPLLFNGQMGVTWPYTEWRWFWRLDVRHPRDEFVAQGRNNYRDVVLVRR